MNFNSSLKINIMLIFKTIQIYTLILNSDDIQRFNNLYINVVYLSNARSMYLDEAKVPNPEGLAEDNGRYNKTGDFNPRFWIQ